MSRSGIYRFIAILVVGGGAAFSFIPGLNIAVYGLMTSECTALEPGYEFCGKSKGWVSFPELNAHKFARSEWRVYFEFDPNVEGYAPDRMIAATKRIVADHPKNTFISVSGGEIYEGGRSVVYRETSVRNGAPVIIITAYAFTPDHSVMTVFNRDGDTFTSSDEMELASALAEVKFTGLAD